jgi:exosome complex component RRP41
LFLAQSDTELAWIVRQSLETVIISSLYPQTRILIVIQIVADDGCVLAAAINGAYLALLDAGIQVFMHLLQFR